MFFFSSNLLQVRDVVILKLIRSDHLVCALVEGTGIKKLVLYMRRYIVSPKSPISFGVRLQIQYGS
jgi:hypothetical protein